MGRDQFTFMETGTLGKPSKDGRAIGRILHLEELKKWIRETQ